MLQSDASQPGEVRRLLSEAQTIAVVGLSADESKDSYRVAQYLKEKGYRVIPVDPTEESVLGEKSYPDLKSIPGQVDVVDVFRRPEHVPEIAGEAISVEAKALWLQLGIRNDEAVQAAAEAGLIAIQDACIKVEHSGLIQ